MVQAVNSKRISQTSCSSTASQRRKREARTNLAPQTSDVLVRGGSTASNGSLNQLAATATGAQVTRRLDRLGLTGQSRNQRQRKAQIDEDLVEAIATAIKANNKSAVRPLWDRATWPEWKHGALEAAPAIGHDNREMQNLMLYLSGRHRALRGTLARQFQAGSAPQPERSLVVKLPVTLEDAQLATPLGAVRRSRVVNLPVTLETAGATHRSTPAEKASRIVKLRYRRPQPAPENRATLPSLQHVLQELFPTGLEWPVARTPQSAGVQLPSVRRLLDEPVEDSVKLAPLQQ